MIVEFSKNDIRGIDKLGIDRLLADLNRDGYSVREVGLLNGEVVHKFPDDKRRNYPILSYGPVVISSEGEANITLENEFEKLWNSGDIKPISPGTRGTIGRLRCLS